MVRLAAREARRWYLDDEAGAAAAAGFVPQAAVVHIEQAGAQEEPQPEPLPPRTLRNERLEQVLPDSLRNTGPGVFGLYAHLGARRAVRFQADPDGGVLAPFERVQGIAH